MLSAPLLPEADGVHVFLYESRASLDRAWKNQRASTLARGLIWAERYNASEARAQAAVVPTEDGVDEQPRDGAEQLTVEGQAATKLMRHREDPLPQGYGRKHVLD